MGTCVIFCAAGFDSLAETVEKDTLVIAADGGMRHTQALGLQPDVILGDFDSLGFVPAGAEVFPVEKDDTDAMLAIRQGLDRGCRRFVIYGGLDGERLDHTLANYQALQYLADRGAEGYLVGLRYLVTVVKDGAISFPAEAAGVVSLFCLGPDAEGVTLRGLKYPLERGRLTAGFPLGVSNHFVGEKSRISVENGSLLVLWDRENGFPER